MTAYQNSRHPERPRVAMMSNAKTEAVIVQPRFTHSKSKVVLERGK